MTVTEFVGYRPAAAYLGVKPSTLSAYVKAGTGPEPELDRVREGGCLLTVFTKEELDRWLEERPGRGRKTKRPTTTEGRPMLRRNTKTPAPAKTPDPRAELVRALADAGEVVASACGTCGATARADDPEAIQEWRQLGTYPYTRKVRGWRYHRVCSRATGGAELLALALDPSARPVRVTQAHYDVAQKLGAPLAYRELEKASSTDAGRGRSPFQHVKRAELDELRAAVAQRHQELTVPVPHSSGRPCGVCGRSHDLVDSWGEFQGRPVCAACSRLIERAKAPGNPDLREYAEQAARSFLPLRGVVQFLLASELPSYGRHDCKVSGELAPWAYVADLPEVPLSDEERLAALLAEAETRLTGAAA